MKFGGRNQSTKLKLKVFLTWHDKGFVGTDGVNVAHLGTRISTPSMPISHKVWPKPQKKFPTFTKLFLSWRIIFFERQSIESHFVLDWKLKWYRWGYTFEECTQILQSFTDWFVGFPCLISMYRVVRHFLARSVAPTRKRTTNREMLVTLVKDYSRLQR